MRRLAAAFAVAVLAAAASSQDAEPVPPPRPVPAEPLTVGARLPTDVEVRFATFNKSPDDGALPGALAKATDFEKPFVVVFWSTKCPVCRRYTAALTALRKDFESRVEIVAVLPNEGDTLAAATSFAADTKIVPALDMSQAAARRLGVAVTPTALVFDAGRVLRYRGSIDDDRRARGRDTTDYLRTALEAVLAGKSVENPEPRAFGSSVRGPKR